MLTSICRKSILKEFLVVHQSLKSIFRFNFSPQMSIDKGQGQTKASEGMHHFVSGHSFAVLFATILFCMVAFNLLKKEKMKKKSAEKESINGASAGVGSGQYDVFLSFRGLDTRKAFTDHLYHSLIKAGTVPLCVFRDDNIIPIGEKFDSKILDAIARSKISIPIISENYASSKWCLLELVRIMDCKRSTSHIVLPIFYKVAPSDVRHLKGNFGNAFRLSHACFDEKDIQKRQ